VNSFKGSSPSLTLNKQSKNTKTTVYTALVGFILSLLLIKNIVQQLSHYFIFSSKKVYFVDFYCRVTAELARSLFHFKNHIFIHPP